MFGNLSNTLRTSIFQPTKATKITRTTRELNENTEKIKTETEMICFHIEIGECCVYL